MKPKPRRKLEPRKSWKQVAAILEAIRESNLTGSPLVLTVTESGIVSLAPNQ